jgi:hypothetical protein
MMSRPGHEEDIRPPFRKSPSSGTTNGNGAGSTSIGGRNTGQVGLEPVHLFKSNLIQAPLLANVLDMDERKVPIISQVCKANQ